MNLDVIARTLGHARKNIGLSEVEAAHHAGVSVATIHNSESVHRAKSGRTIDLRTFLSLLSAYRLTMATFERLAADLAIRSRLEEFERRLDKLEKSAVGHQNDG